MLEISASAAEAIIDLTIEQRLSDDAGVRISADPENAGALRLDLVGGASDSDRMVEDHGAYAFVDAALAPLLDDKVLDVSREAGKYRFTVLEREV